MPVIMVGAPVLHKLQYRLQVIEFGSQCVVTVLTDPPCAPTGAATAGRAGRVFYLSAEQVVFDKGAITLPSGALPLGHQAPEPSEWGQQL